MGGVREEEEDESCSKGGGARSSCEAFGGAERTRLIAVDSAAGFKAAVAGEVETDAGGAKGAGTEGADTAASLCVGG